MRFSFAADGFACEGEKNGVLFARLAPCSVRADSWPVFREFDRLARQGGAGNFGGDPMKYLPIAFVVCCLAANLSAGTIPILNPNFDAQVLAPGTATGYGFIPITDWSQNDAVNTDYSVYNPVASSYPGGVPGGHNVADVFSDGTTASIWQFLATDLQANDTYTLTGYAGYRLDTGVFAPGLDGCNGNAMVEAGGNVLNAAVIGGNINNGTGCTPGTFTQFSITFTTGANPAGLGLPLEIVLETLGTGSVYEPSELDFTGITLSDTASSDSGSGSAVPEPATFGTMAAAVALCLFRFRRRTA
jgi:hypothetical protein